MMNLKIITILLVQVLIMTNILNLWWIIAGELMRVIMTNGIKKDGAIMIIQMSNKIIRISNRKTLVHMV